MEKKYPHWHKINQTKPRWVYALVDPRDSRVRYIGASIIPETRLHRHIVDARRYQQQIPSAKRDWLCDLIQNELRPLVVRVEKCAPTDWQERENYWIVKLFNAGADLTNVIIRGNIRLTSLYPTED